MGIIFTVPQWRCIFAPNEGIYEMNQNIERNVIIGFSVAMFLLVVLAGVSIWKTMCDEEINRNMLNVHKMIKEIDDIQVRMHQAEIGIQGYVITGRESRLKPFTTAQAMIYREVEDVRMFLSDNPSQKRTLERIEILIRERFSFYQNVLKIQRSAGQAAALRMVQSEREREGEDEISRLLILMTDDEMRMLDGLSSEVRKTDRDMKIIVPAGSIFGFILIALAILVINRGVTRLRLAQETVR